MHESKETQSPAEPVRDAMAGRPHILYGVTADTVSEMVEFAARMPAGAGFDGVEWSVPMSVTDSGLPATDAKTVSPVVGLDAACAVGAISIPWSLGEDAGRRPALADWLGWANTAGVRLLRLAIRGATGACTEGQPASSLVVDVGTALFKLLEENRFAAEAAGVDVAVDASAVGSELGVIALRELVDAVSSPAVGVCASANAEGYDLAAATRHLAYRANIMCLDFTALSAVCWRDVATYVCRPVTIVVRGSVDAAQARRAIARILDGFA